ncbi:MAG TPA: Gfo/Idh/MocA family oxidoreductase [Stellaceae bacterium]|jgi:predicted dehydrogenase|nr:Gfo/Idh/MocA family oxidoreductase [Stellaceae bacterium]
MLNAAVIGLGWWGKTIVRTLANHDRIRVTAGVDPAPDAAETAQSLGIVLLPGLAAVLADRAIHVVILCTPHKLHGRQIAEIAATGRHIFCEKPLCLTRAEAEHAIAICFAHNVVLGVGHERRFEPPMLELRRLVESGALGTLLQIEANFSQDKFLALPPDNWRLSPVEAPAGPMTATGIHLLDLSISFLGPAERALASCRTLGTSFANGDTLAAMVEFKSGAHAMISAILTTPFEGRFAIYGSQGWAEVRDKTHPEAPEGWTFTTDIRGEGRKSQEFASASSVKANLDAFADACLGRNPYPMPDSQKVETVAALEAIFRSVVSNQIEMVS